MTVQARKQHFIPQSLLKGFEAQRKRKTVYVHVYQKGKSPLCTATHNVAAQRDFYSQPATDDTLTLDEVITKYETGLAERIVNLRQKGHSDLIDSAEAAGLVVHLAVRGSYIRELFDFGFKSLLGETTTLLSDTESLRSLIGIDDSKIPCHLSEALEPAIQALRGILPAKFPDALVKQFVFLLLREGFGDFSASIAPQLSTLVQSLAAAAPGMLYKGHAQALSASLAPDARVTELARFHWNVLEAPGRDLILPDCVALAAGSGGVSFAPYFTNDFETVDAIYLPLCSDRLLIGRRNQEHQSSIESFNLHAARCSVRFFVSSKTSAEFERLKEMIGTQPFAQVRYAVSEALRENRQQIFPPSIGMAQPNDACGTDAENPEWQTSISFLNWESEVSAQEIGAVVGAVVREVARWMPLRRLDSVIFADDYGGAINSLDRGFETPAMTLVSEDFGEGVALAPLVMRDGAPMIVIILRGWIGRSLLSDELLSDPTALHVLTFMLARAGYFTLFQAVLPNALYAKELDYLERLKFSNMYDASSVYFAARYSAATAEHACKSYREVLVGALDHYGVAISKAKEVYFESRQLDGLLEIATDGVAKILEYAAKLVGHCDELDQPVDDEAQSLSKALTSAGLLNWLDVYRRDMRSLFGQRGQWEGVADFIELNCHTERLLWQFGIFAWRLPDGQVWVEVVQMPKS